MQIKDKIIIAFRSNGQTETEAAITMGWPISCINALMDGAPLDHWQAMDLQEHFGLEANELMRQQAHLEMVKRSMLNITTN